MTYHSVRKLDRRFNLHRKHQFAVLLEWEWEATREWILGRDQSIYREFRQYVRAAERAFGTQYFEYANPGGRWDETTNYHKTRRAYKTGRLFIRSEKNLTLLQLAV